MKKSTLALLAALALNALPAHAGQWDDLRNQWREEYKQVSNSDISILESQAGNGDVRAVYMLGRLQDDKRYAPSPKQATRLHQQSCELGDAGHAIMMVCCGWELKVGAVVAKDETEAVNWFRKAAEAGYANAQDNLGVMYRDGKGVSQSNTEAVNWFRKSAEQGNADGQANFGWMYLEGQGASQSYADALYWTRKAVEQGNAVGQNNLGWMYQYGKGVSQSYTEAVKWYRKAAAQGNQLAKDNLRNLGESY